MAAHRIIPTFIVCLFFLASSPRASASPLCESWSFPQFFGFLDNKDIPEASGLAISAQFPDRLYHINDRGRTSKVIVTTLSGKTVQRFSLEDFKPYDTEEISIGPCNGKTCLYIGDIGDNRRRRTSVGFTWLKEKNAYADEEKALGRISLVYPDRAHNAEAFIIHPATGELFIFTKGGVRKNLPAEPSRIYSISAQELHSGRPAALLKYRGALNVPLLLSHVQAGLQVVTGAAITASGSHLMLLTYRHVIEIEWEKLLVPGDVPRVHTLALLPLKEAIAFMPGENAFIFTTELKKSDAPMFGLSCLD